MKHTIHESLARIGLSKESLSMALDLPLTDLEAWMRRYAAMGKIGIRDDVAAVFEYIEQKAENADDALLYARTMHSASENDDREEVDVATVPDVTEEDTGFTFFQDPEHTNIRVVAPIPKGWMIINLHGHLASLVERAPYLKWSVKFCLRTPALDTAENVMLINRWHTTEKFIISDFDAMRCWANHCSTFFENLGLMPYVGKAMIQSVGVPTLARILKLFGGNDEV